MRYDRQNRNLEWKSLGLSKLNVFGDNFLGQDDLWYLPRHLEL